MEDPIKFDVWGKLIPSAYEAALAAIRATKVYSGELELRKALNNARHGGCALKVTTGMSWSVAHQFLKNSFWLEEPILCQEGYSPDDHPFYCEKHRLYYGGCLGCHVCSGFYER